MKQAKTDAAVQPSRRNGNSRKSPASGEVDPSIEMKKSEATRRRILDAAALVMSREGFAGTKLADIAAEAKVKIAALYYYFESREDLVEAVIVTGSEQVRLHTEAAIAEMDPSSSPMDRLCSAIEAHLRYILEISHYTEAAVRNSSQVPEQIRKAIRAEQTRYGRFWQGLVDAAAAGTRYRTPAQRKALRMLILGGLNWTVEWWTPDQAPLEQVLGTAIDMARATLLAARA
jgi:TetR/AcrR family transcriptional regulator, cholesterol catabolism regulator